MKKKNLKSRLVLNKHTIADLDGKEMKVIKGGDQIYLTQYCDTKEECRTLITMQGNCTHAC